MADRQQSAQRAPVQIIQQLAELPPWLETAVDPERITAMLRQRVPELASGSLTLQAGPFYSLNLKNTEGRWVGVYNFIVEKAGHPARPLTASGTLYAPNLSLPDGIEAASQAAFGTPGWSCWLSEQRLLLTCESGRPTTEPPPQLSDPEQARSLLERTLR